jgi:hypothetical protein
MHRLENRHKGERAIVIMGGPSLLKTGCAVERLRDKGFVVFLESKALTRRFLDWRLPVDYYQMFYPEKSKSTSFQMVVLQAILSKLDLKPFVREERHEEIDHILSNQDHYFTPGPQNITHKRLRWRPDVFLPGSPFDLLAEIPTAALIAYRPALDAAVEHQTFSQAIHTFETNDDAPGVLPLESYYRPSIQEGRLVLQGSRMSNSAAIALYPLLKFMGFAKSYFLGADMTMLGSMEHSAPFTFCSMEAFRAFFERARRAFGTHFPSSDRRDAWNDLAARWKLDGLSALASRFFYDSVAALVSGASPFLRPRVEIRDAKRLLCAAPGIEFINVLTPYRYVRPHEGIRNIPFDQLLKE